jgi:aromatic amino acid aminotransferase I / 2-aminoadipate transaminase
MATSQVEQINTSIDTITTSISISHYANDTHSLRAAFGVEDVAQLRSRSQPLPTNVAASTNSNMYKSPACFRYPKSKAWDHRFTRETASRGPSRLRQLATVSANPGLITLGSGRPSSEYFPFEQLNIKIPKAPFFLGPEATENGVTITTGKYDMLEGKSSYDLAISMNYSHGAGSAQLLRFVTEHTEIVHHPLYSDWECCLTAGSTSGLDMVYRMFCNPGDHILMEEYTYSGALEGAHPLGLKIIGVKMDSDGLLPSDLDFVLSNWDKSPGAPQKPFLLYTIPTGQNPTGASQSLDRRREIYAVAEKHDLYIVEDDPYYFLQLEEYDAALPQEIGRLPGFEPEPTEAFLSQLLPSYLSLDTSGRVLRLDSTAKTLAPGLRCGWMTASSQVVQRFLYHQDVSTVQPSGASQLIMYKVVDEAWGHKGFLQWLMFLRYDYTRRRNIMLSACEQYLPREVCTWDIPRAGMFHWIELKWQEHPVMKRACRTYRTEEANRRALEERIFRTAVRKGVLYCQGSWFRAENTLDDRMFLRTTFSAAPLDKVREAIERLGSALKEEFELAT